MPTATAEPEVTFLESTVGSSLRGLLAVGTGKKRAVYAVAEVPPERAGRAFLLKKVEGGTDSEADGYRMTCTYGGLPVGCDCRGWLRWAKCLHTTQVGRLVFTGQL